MALLRHIIEAQRDWYKPNWLYESIPGLYMGAGVFTFVLLRNAVGMFSGGLFIVSSVVVSSQRYLYRRQKALARAEKEEEHKELKKLGTIVWRSSFHCGDKLIDEQHKFLVSEANRIIGAIIDDEQELDYEKTLVKLLRDIQRHFRDEEKFLIKMLPEVAPQHKATHQKLMNQAMSLVDDIRAEEATPYELLSFLLINVITKHVVSEDLKWKDMLEG